MNRKLIAVFIASALMAPSVNAIELYDDGTNNVTIGGFIDTRVIHTQGQTEIVNGASRISFDFSRKLKNQWTALALLEWGVNPVGSSDIIYNNRFESI
ncbi:hypothetical protein LCGC14_2579080, partial [marine sediment metagenome]